MVDSVLPHKTRTCTTTNRHYANTNAKTVPGRDISQLVVKPPFRKEGVRASKVSLNPPHTKQNRNHPVCSICWYNNCSSWSLQSNVIVHCCIPTCTWSIPQVKYHKELTYLHNTWSILQVKYHKELTYLHVYTWSIPQVKYHKELTYLHVPGVYCK